MINIAVFRNAIPGLRALFILLFVVLASLSLRSQVMEGELRLTVTDASGSPVAAKVELNGRNPQFHAESESDIEGQARLQRLPFGVYRLRVIRHGFQPFSRRVEIQSAVPIEVEAILQLAEVVTEITVEEPAPVLDATRPNMVFRAGREQLMETPGTTLGRSTIDVVTTMPGWLLEANAVLHPRGSEYDTQYVVDGMPFYDNRSLAFAPPFENDEFESVNVMTAGMPAEYGRRMGGVIALDTKRVETPGRSFEASLQAGSFDTYQGSLAGQYRSQKTSFTAGVHGGHTQRFLDPPSLENFTNQGNAGGVHLRLDRDVTPGDRLSFYLRSNQTGFEVPNDLLQQEAGQRQGRNSNETSGQIHYQKTLSTTTLLSLRSMVRDLTSELNSNLLSTPAYVEQNRGFRQGVVAGDVSHRLESHTLKFGGDVRLTNLRERFGSAEADEAPELDVDFRDQKRATEASLFVQDQIVYGNFAANIGARFDHYRLLIDDRAFSPRMAVSYYVPQADLQIRAAYDRVFQPPPMENLLFSNAAAGLGLDEVEEAVAVPASRANFYEIGISKSFWKIFRVDVSQYWRNFENYIDDDVFLNTGLSFPITFDGARIRGTEVRLEMPRWRSLSGFVSYANMLGHASSPVTGGLFVEGGEANELREPGLVFPITQDQRNTTAAQVRWQAHPRVWLTAGARYGSGLPVELEVDDDDPGAEPEEEEHEEQEIPQAILDRVNFERGRVRPSFSLNLSVGAELWQHGNRSTSVQVDVRNLTDRLNVINFSGLFSGTALAPGRQVTVQLRTRF